MTLILVALYLPHRFSPAAAATSFAHPGFFWRKKKPPHQKTAKMAAEVEENGQFKKLLQATWSNGWIRNWKTVGSQASPAS